MLLKKVITYLSYSLVLLAQLVLAIAVIEKPAQAQTPVGYWKFDDGSGNKAADSSGNGHTAKLVNGVSWVTGKIGDAVSANAANSQYVGIPAIDLSGTNAVTVAFWANRTYSTVGGHVLFEATKNYHNSTTGFAFFPDDDTCNGIQAALRGNQGSTANCYNQPSSGVWHHLVVVFDKGQTGGNEVAFYVDGVLQTPNWSVSASTNTNNFGNNPIYLFSRGGKSQFTSGVVDDLRIYNSALNAAQIQQIYNGAASVSLLPRSFRYRRPTFTISASPTSLSVGQGNQGTSTITTAISGGFNSSISLSASGLPTGTTVSFNPSTIPAPGAGSSTMTITVGSSTPVGTYPITVTGNGGGTQVTATVNLTVTAQAPSVALTWTASTSPVVGYNVYRSANSGGPYTELNSSLISSTNYTDLTVQSGLTYYYVSTAVNSQGIQSAYSNQAVATVP